MTVTTERATVAVVNEVRGSMTNTMENNGSIFKAESITSICFNSSCKECCEMIAKDPVNTKKISGAFNIWTPLLVVVMIALTQVLISSFILYFVVDGDLFWSWEYFKPMFIGL